MNWATRIFILYTGFVVMMLLLVFGAVKQEFHLVTEDYYAEEIKYQDKIHATYNANKMATPLRMETSLPEKLLRLTFPADQPTPMGEVHFYKPDNARQDRAVTLQVLDHRQEISLAGMARGRWLTKVSWVHGGIAYFQQDSLFLP